MKLLFYTLALFFLASCSSSKRSTGLPEGWVLLGNSKINYVRDVDEIKVYDLDAYTGLKVKVENKDLRVFDMKVYFESGDVLDAKLDDVIPAGEMSRTIPLGDNGRRIDHIEFKARSTGNLLKGRSRVKIFGEKYGYYRRS